MTAPARTAPLAVWQALVVVAVAFAPPALLGVRWLGADENARIALLGDVLYWSMPCVLVIAGIGGAWRWRGRTTSLSGAGKRLAPGLALACAVAALVFATVPAAMRQQFDETCLLGASQNMHGQRAAWVTTAAVPFHGAALPLENLVDKRPPLFAFLVSLLHDVTGYRVANAFVLNGALLGLGLTLAFALVRARLGLVAACAAPLLLWAVPLTAVVATSAGFELLATVLLLLVLMAALDCVRTPDAPRFAGLLGAGLLFAQARYESLPTFGLLLALVWWNVKGRFRPGFGGWLLLAAVFASTTPLALLLLHAQNPNFYPEAGGHALVSFANLFAHAATLARHWFSLRPDNVLPGLLAIPATGAAVWWLWQRRGRDVVIVAMPLVALTVIALAWFYGDADEPTALRLFLPLAWATALAPLLLVERWGKRAAGVALALPFVLAAWRLLGGAALTPVPQFTIAEIVEAVDGLATRHDPDRGHSLWVSTTAQSLIVHGHAAMTAAAFARRQPDLQALSRQGDLRAIFVVETPLDAAMAPEHGSPHDLVQRLPADVVARSVGPQTVTVWRLRR